MLSVRASLVLQTKWTANELRTTDLCFSPEAELHQGVEIVDIPYNMYRRSALALTSGILNDYQVRLHLPSYVEKDLWLPCVSC